MGDSTIGKVTSTYDPNTWEWHSPYHSEKGWECPRCGRVWAPWVTSCDCSRSHTTITWGSGTGNPLPEKYKYEITCNANGSIDVKDTKDFVNSSVTRFNPDIPHTYTSARCANNELKRG